MFLLDGSWVISASDLVAQMECDHSTSLRMAVKAGLLDVSEQATAGMLELAATHGGLHEARMLEQLRTQGLEIVEIADPGYSRDAIEGARDATLAAMRSGVDVVYQAVFFDGEFLGKADFVRRVGGSVDTGWSYEVWDTKLARHAKPGALLQMAAYSEQITAAGFPAPERMHVWLGSKDESHHDVDDVLPVLHRVREVLRTRLAEPAAPPVPLWADARHACGHCRFDAFCSQGREDARDLSLVAGIHVTHRRRLHDSGVHTVEQLAVLEEDDRPAGISSGVFDRLVAQARLQAQQHADGIVRHTVYSTDGLELLPLRSEGDVWFDMEGDPFALNGRGLEYLFGAVTTEDDSPEFTAFWGHGIPGERMAFEGFVDFVEFRRSVWPNLHVYHYASYERSALTRLAGQHGTREGEIDNWLRSDLLVDLYTVVRRSIRVSQASYSIKKLETLYGRERHEDVKTAGDSVVDYEAYLDLQAGGSVAEAQEKLDGIEAYNAVDCLSTWELDRWLRDLPEYEEVDLDSFEPTPHDDGSTTDPEEQSLIEALLKHVPDDPADRSDEDQAYAMLAATLAYHQREDKPAWWRHYTRLGATIEELEDDPDVLVIDRVTAGPWVPKRTNSSRELVVLPDHDSEFRASEGNSVFLVHGAPPAGFPGTEGSGRGTTSGTITSVSDGGIVITESAPMAVADLLGLPIAVLPNSVVRTEALRDRVRILARDTVRARDWPQSPAHDLLARSTPVTRAELPRTGNDVSDVAEAVRRLEASYLAVQGPPGSGKTYLGAHVIAALIAEGWRIGVVAQSHAVVENLLDRAIEAGVPASCVAKEPKKGSAGGVWARTSTQVNELLGDNSRGVLIGGTAWTFCRAAATPECLDLMVVDEAGQFSLANTVAVSVAARNLLLLGDPAQLPQVSQGTHPEPVNDAALQWIAGGSATLPDEFGYFLATSWRMHPMLCKPVSRLAYRGRLHAHPRTARRSLQGIAPGIHWVPVEHQERSIQSPEEVTAVLALINELLGTEWTSEEGIRDLVEYDILVVSPYNRQVDAIASALRDEGPEGVRVGTVDRFQGQEAPVVIVSMTASSQEDVPRGLDFLLSRNRLNVAVSRAQWAAYVVHSPELASFSPTSVTQLTLLGGFLGLAE